MPTLSRARAWVRARIIPDARRAWRFASVRLAVLGVVLEAVLQFGELDRWLSPIAELSTRVVLFGAIVVGRLAKQERPDGR